ncbi:MAG: hypothetical protein Q8R08_00740, partial [bacterium]|nr:hypothetical protein [bacterium]
MAYYYKFSVGSILEEAVPKEEKSKFKLTERQIETAKTVSGVILAVLLGAGIIALTAVAPNIFVALDKIFGSTSGGNRWSKSPRNKTKVTKAIYYLKSQGNIKLTRKGDDFLVEITQKGRKKTRKFQFDGLELERQKKWDHRWWMVIADVPLKYRRNADLFREKLKELGFYRLQKTVWFYPFDMRDEIDFVSAYYHLSNFVSSMRS